MMSEAELKMLDVLNTCGGNLREAAIRYDLFYGTLSDNFLAKVDRASMAHALEVRSPFLDYRFIEFESRIPVKWKASPFQTKILMRDMIAGMVPDEIARRSKQGFTPPLLAWINEKKYSEVLRKGYLTLRNRGVLSQGWDGFFNNVAFKSSDMVSSLYKIRLLMLIKWHEMWRRRMEA